MPKVRTVKGKIIKYIYDNTIYRGCAIYPSEKATDIRNNVFENCSFRTQLNIHRMEMLNDFENCTFSEGVNITCDYFYPNILSGCPDTLRPHVHSISMNINPYKSNSVGFFQDIGKFVNLRNFKAIYTDDGRLGFFPGVFFLEKLESLDCTSCGIRTIPKKIKNLTNLRVLALDHNKISKIPEEILELENLRVFSINYNNVRTLPWNMHEMKSLEHLLITSGNSIPIDKITNLRLNLGDILK